MEPCACANDCSSVARCDIFEFMAKHVGMTVIHPGGFAATNRLIRALDIKPGSNVIDIACGKGTTAVLLAEKYGCNVTAVDIDEALVEEGKELARKRGLADKVAFIAGDAMDLPFTDNTFDAAVSQAMLVLVDDKIKAIQEAHRVLRQGGSAGWLELSWRKEPSAEFIKTVSTVICAYCMTNVSTFDGWKGIFKDAGIRDVNVIPLDFNPGSGGMMGMFKDEGFFRSLAMMARVMRKREIRERMAIINSFFKENSDIFGCGIYHFKK